jgi:hypothetical protein
MAPLPPLPRHLASLSRLPIDDLRGYATHAYNHPPYTQPISAVLATGMFVAPGAVLIGLYPPEVPPEKALAEPPDFPTWRYDIDGRWLYIATRAEYDQLDAGHSGRPDGPWPEDVVTQVPWTIGQGLYAPVAGWRPYGSAPEPQGHPDRRVYYPMTPDIYSGRAYAVGEVFFLNGHNVVADDTLLATGAVTIVPRFVTPLPHTPTGRWFLDKTTLADYVLGYQDGGVSDFVVAETEGATEAAEPRLGRPRTAEWRTWSLEDIRTLLSEARGQIRRTNPDPKISEIIAASGFPRETIRKGLKQYGHTPTTIRPLLDD